MTHVTRHEAPQRVVIGHYPIASDEVAVIVRRPHVGILHEQYPAAEVVHIILPPLTGHLLLRDTPPKVIDIGKTVIDNEPAIRRIRDTRFECGGTFRSDDVGQPPHAVIDAVGIGPVAARKDGTSRLVGKRFDRMAVLIGRGTLLEETGLAVICLRHGESARLRRIRQAQYRSRSRSSWH